jgi:hypothetical protein
VPSRDKRARQRAASYGYSGEHFSLEEWEALLELVALQAKRAGNAAPLARLDVQELEG